MQGKHVILGVTGGIAAYKAAYLVRSLVKAGAEVKVIMTENAKKFVTPLTFSTLSGNPVYTEFFNPENGEWHSHVKLGVWADLFIVAPATANTLAKMAHGIADNLLTTTYLSARCRTLVVPAMDLDMYAAAATQDNLETLRRRGVIVMDPASGFLASGLEGKGRMPEPEDIMRFAANVLAQQQDLTGKKVLITAGPTYENIDPVRFIGNYSTGKMGYAIADECAQRGADVTVVSGPVSIEPKNKNVKVVSVRSAAEMFAAADKLFTEADITVLSAAVADFTPIVSADEKIKREKDNLTLELRPTVDIAASLGKKKREGQIFVGFALETNNEEQNAQSKLERKNFDFIVLNSMRNPGTCFGSDNNQIKIIDRDNITSHPLKSKAEVAKDIVDKIVSWGK
ncbi:MAG: bifunctional phosphopantothenoylcysteine decarboxylase/phosphopantothenate--cysteine ligase CoaBC [Paludibacteraceae bacterium]|nr:bifunctional phosphopantothenoylcysteine decarboxylase/phosphopantothenate--cysteine ligase CoaBC [Paludibacteraceae bacterium]MBQ1851589.1 bifunctional phosphopantothenoylcysteine decarboxylase/phosphopantothenate--cysteine ligase CoaBC [Paludibacteraceae bacterium]